MGFNKDSNPMNAAPKGQEKHSTGKETIHTAHGKEEQAKANDSQFLHVQQKLEHDRRHPQGAPILILQGNQIIQVGPSIADPTLVPQLVPSTKIEFTNKSASGSLVKTDGESTKKSLARAKDMEKTNGVSDVHSVILVNDADRPHHRESVRMAKTNHSPPPASPKPKRTPSSKSHQHKKPTNASPKKSSSKVASSRSDSKTKLRETVEKVKSKSKSPRRKKKPTSSKMNNKSVEQMSKSKSKSDKHRQSSSSNPELKKSGQPKLVKIKTKSSSGKAHGNMKSLKNAESANSSASTESNNFKSPKSPKSHCHKKGK